MNPIHPVKSSSGNQDTECVQILSQLVLPEKWFGYPSWLWQVMAIQFTENVFMRTSIKFYII